MKVLVLQGRLQCIRINIGKSMHMNAYCMNTDIRVDISSNIRISTNIVTTISTSISIRVNIPIGISKNVSFHQYQYSRLT